MSWTDRLLIMEALAALTAASLAIRVLPFRKVVVMATPKRTSPGLEIGDVALELQRVRWALVACANRVPFKAVCFQKGLAAQVMLRRRKIPATLHYGVRQDKTLGLQAHVWVTACRQDVVGGEVADRFACLATFPPGKDGDGD
jgi:hypothetical protein